MRTQVLDGLHAAKNRGAHRMSKASMEVTADLIVLALADAKDPIPPTLEVLPASTAIVNLGAIDMVAFIARATTKVTPRTSRMGTEVIDLGDAYGEQKFLMWRLQRLFGCHSFASPSDFATEAKVAGHDSDRAALLTVFRGLVEVGQPLVDGWRDEDAAQFWQTIGSLIAGSENGKAQANDDTVKARCTAARELCVETWGEPRIVKPPVPAENGSPVYEVAAKALAEVAL